MNRFLKLLGYRDTRYRGANFTVRIERKVREVVRVIYNTGGREWEFGGEYFGKAWRNIAVGISQEIAPTEATIIAGHLAEAMKAMGNGYVISQAREVELVPESEREEAISELNAMGYEIEVLPNGAVRQTRRPGSPKLSREKYKKQAPRMMKLIGSVREKRRRSETLAQSEEF